MVDTKQVLRYLVDRQYIHSGNQRQLAENGGQVFRRRTILEWTYLKLAATSGTSGNQQQLEATSGKWWSSFSENNSREELVLKVICAA